jgi:hypothetical protein
MDCPNRLTLRWEEVVVVVEQRWCQLALYHFLCYARPALLVKLGAHSTQKLVVVDPRKPTDDKVHHTPTHLELTCCGGQ